MVTIRCSVCRRKLFRYHKVGKGKILRMYKERIAADYSIHKGNEILCPCGNVIGIDVGPWIKMKGGRFTVSGSRERSFKEKKGGNR